MWPAKVQRKGAGMRKFWLVADLLTALLVVLSTHAARAQSMDYGSLQELFGEPVTTSATGTPQRASEVAANMTIITADQIRQSGRRSIPEIVGMYVPGINVMQAGFDAFDVGVRGYQQPYQPRLLVLLDGHQVFNDDYSRTQWGDIPVNIDNVRQIEVVKGASSALFGSNATGGVINIITYSPTYDSKTVATFGAGTQSAFVGDGTVNVKAGGIAASVSGGGFGADELNSGRTPVETHAMRNPYHRYIVQNSEAEVNSNLRFNTETSYSENDDLVSSFRYTVTPTKTISYSGGGGFTWQTPYGQIISNNYVNHHYDNLTALGLGEATLTNTLITSQLADVFKIGASHAFRLEVEYRYNDFSDGSETNLSISTGHLEENHYALAGTWLSQITGKMALTNALRIDHNDARMMNALPAVNPYTQSAYTQSYDTVAANSGLTYKVTDQDTVRATFGRGIENPSLLQYGNSVNISLIPSVTNLLLVGNPNLKPTIVQNYELSYDRIIPDILSTGTVSVFYASNRDVIGYANLPSTSSGGITYLNRSFENVGDSRGYGGEIEIKGSHPTGFRWDASYSLQSIHDAAGVTALLDYGGSAPQSQLRLNLGYTTGPWEVDAHGQYASSTDMLRSYNQGATNAEAGTPSFATLGARIGYNFGDHYTAALSGTNITNEYTRENPYVRAERQVLLTVTGKL